MNTILKKVLQFNFLNIIFIVFYYDLQHSGIVLKAVLLSLGLLVKYNMFLVNSSCC